LSLTAGAGAVQGDKKFRMYDDCDHQHRFNAVLGDGACIGNGFLKQLLTSSSRNSKQLRTHTSGATNQPSRT
jgi:hypothetical protein